MPARNWRQRLTPRDLKLVLCPLMMNSGFLLRENLVAYSAHRIINAKFLMRRNLIFSVIDLASLRTVKCLVINLSPLLSTEIFATL